MEYIDGFMQAKRRKAAGAGARDAGRRSRHGVARDDRGRAQFKRLDGVEAALNRIIHDNFAGGRQTLELTPRLGDVSVPVQVIWGRQDRIVPVSHAERLPANVPVRVFDNAGHMVHMEKAAEVNELIKLFVG